MRGSDEGFPLNWRGHFSRLADRLEQKRANLAKMRFGIAIGRTQRGVFRRIASRGVVVMANITAGVADDVQAVMVMMSLTLGNQRVQPLAQQGNARVSREQKPAQEPVTRGPHSDRGGLSGGRVFETSLFCSGVPSLATEINCKTSPASVAGDAYSRPASNKKPPAEPGADDQIDR
jgi:hypothetical protein